SYISELDGLNKVLPINLLGDARWKPPKNPFARINLDATYKTLGKRSCLGLVVRGSNGRVFDSRIVINENIPSAFTADALACAQGIQLGLDLGVTILE
ncbi:hypothetical protein Golob_023982, partial [Gossypium lobatum]|nr:hypothetical protein [Gossypium lobatum]